MVIGADEISQSMPFIVSMDVLSFFCRYLCILTWLISKYLNPTNTQFGCFYLLVYYPYKSLKMTNNRWLFVPSSLIFGRILLRNLKIAHMSRLFAKNKDTKMYPIYSASYAGVIRIANIISNA
jgi:hypothetical protein